MRVPLVFICLLAASCASSPRVAGPVALNADTFLLAGRPVRLVGVNGANGSLCSTGPQSYGCSGEGRRALSRLLRAGPVRCVPSRLGDGTSQCWSRQGDLSALQIRSGNGTATDRSGRYDYSADMRIAMQAEIGLYKATFILDDKLRRDMERNPPVTYGPPRPPPRPADDVAQASYDIVLSIRENGRVVGTPRLRVTAGQRASVTVGTPGAPGYTLALLPVEERVVDGPGLRLEMQLTVRRGERSVRIPLPAFYLALGRPAAEEAWSADAEALFRVEAMAGRSAAQR